MDYKKHGWDKSGSLCLIPDEDSIIIGGITKNWRKFAFHFIFYSFFLWVVTLFLSNVHWLFFSKDEINVFGEYSIIDYNTKVQLKFLKCNT